MRVATTSKARMPSGAADVRAHAVAASARAVCTTDAQAPRASHGEVGFACSAATAAADLPARQAPATAASVHCAAACAVEHTSRQARATAASARRAVAASATANGRQRERGTAWPTHCAAVTHTWQSAWVAAATTRCTAAAATSDHTPHQPQVEMVLTARFVAPSHHSCTTRVAMAAARRAAALDATRTSCTRGEAMAAARRAAALDDTQASRAAWTAHCTAATSPGEQVAMSAARCAATAASPEEQEVTLAAR